MKIKGGSNAAFFCTFALIIRKTMNFKKNILPYIVIAILFVAAAVIYCYPVLEGKVIGNADGVNGTAAVQECPTTR